MPIYHTLGKIPSKRHTTFRKKDGSLYHEQLFGTIGFDGMSTLMYHHHRPTMVKSIGEAIDVTPKAAVHNNMTSRMLQGFNVKPTDDFLDAREIILFNSDIRCGNKLSEELICPSCNKGYKVHNNIISAL